MLYIQNKIWHTLRNLRCIAKDFLHNLDKRFANTLLKEK